MRARIDELRGELLRALRAEKLSPRERVLACVRSLDLACDAAVRSDDAEVESVVRSALARAAVALAPLLTPAGGSPYPTVENTERAAASFLASPSEERWDAFFEASTDSYPFGPGDGCLAVDELGGHGAPGAGDGGAGFIWYVAEQAGAAPVSEALKRALEDWLAGAGRSSG